MKLLHKDSIEVRTIATLLGCRPNSGLVNRINRLRAHHPALRRDDVTYGKLHKAVLFDMLLEAHNTYT